MFIGVKGIRLKYTNYKTLCAFVINARLQYLCIMYALHSVRLIFKVLTVYVTEGNLERFSWFCFLQYILIKNFRMKSSQMVKSPLNLQNLNLSYNTMYIVHVCASIGYGNDHEVHDIGLI